MISRGIYNLAWNIGHNAIRTTGLNLASLFTGSSVLFFADKLSQHSSFHGLQKNTSPCGINHGHIQQFCDVTHDSEQSCEIPLSTR